jgi:hypothetical protein
MTGIHGVAPSIHLQSTRYVDDGRGRPARTPSRLVSMVRRVRAPRTIDARLPRWVDATTPGAA